jgi:hypothetical protein
MAFIRAKTKIRGLILPVENKGKDFSLFFFKDHLP